MRALFKLWNRPAIRAYIYQILFIALLIATISILVLNTIDSLNRLGIDSGFGFLFEVAGFAISESLLDYKPSYPLYKAFLVGLANTIYVSITGIVLATLLGFIFGIARLSKNWLIARLSAVYVDTIRNIPLLLQLFFWYFAVLKSGFIKAPREFSGEEGIFFLSLRGLYTPKPIFEAGFGFVTGALVIAVIAVYFLRRWSKLRQATTGQQFPLFWSSLAILIVLPGLVFCVVGMPMSFEYPQLKGFNFSGGFRVSPEFAALLLGLSIYTSAFIAEIVRSGIASVPAGQKEAAESLGLKPSWTIRMIIIPQALRVIIPPLTSQYLNLTKNSSLAVAIAFPDLVNVAGTSLNNSGQALEIMGLTVVVYLFLSLTISLLMNWYNSRKALIER